LATACLMLIAWSPALSATCRRRMTVTPEERALYAKRQKKSDEVLKHKIQFINDAIQNANTRVPDDPNEYVNDLFQRIDSADDLFRKDEEKHDENKRRAQLCFYTKAQQLVDHVLEIQSEKWEQKLENVLANIKSGNQLVDVDGRSFEKEMDKRLFSYSWRVSGRETERANQEYVQRTIYKVWLYTFLLQRTTFKKDSVVLPKQAILKTCSGCDGKWLGHVSEDVTQTSSVQCGACHGTGKKGDGYFEEKTFTNTPESECNDSDESSSSQPPRPTLKLGR